MIIKLIESKATTREAPRYAEVLARYMADAKREQMTALHLLTHGPAIEHGLSLSSYMTHGDEGDERPSAAQPVRVLARGGVTAGRTMSWDDATEDMRDRLSRKLPPGAKPVRHVIASLRTGEAPPDADQCAQIATTLLEELRCPQALALWALHGDTDNLHLHLMIVTVDPASANTTAFGNKAGYKDAMQRAIARLDQSLGLQREAGTLYEMENGKLKRRGAPPERVKGAAPIDNRVLAWERESGLSSFTRMAQERAGPILRQAKNWEEVHRAMAEVGMEIRARAGGGEICAGDEHVKLARVGRDLTWKKLNHADRLGPYAPPPPDLVIQSYSPRVDNPEQFERWLQQRARKAELAAATERRVQMLRVARDRAIASAWTSSTDILSMLPASTPPHVRAQLRERLRGARDEHVAALRSIFDSRIQAVRMVRDAAADLPDLAGFSLPDFALGELIVTGAPSDSTLRPEPHDIAGHDARRVGHSIQYWSRTESLRRPAFTDHGTVLVVNSLEPASIEAVLKIAADRFGRIEISGPPEFIAESRRIAGKLRIALDVVDQVPLTTAPRPDKNVGWRRLHRLFEQGATRENNAAQPRDKHTRKRSAGPQLLPRSDIER
ncbi:TraI [Sphingomonas paucimobilis]|nr:TraI [Sphingomonas paucimobilis]